MYSIINKDLGIETINVRSTDMNRVDDLLKKYIEEIKAIYGTSLVKVILFEIKKFLC